jgi:hypothetical protein
MIDVQPCNTSILAGLKQQAQPAQNGTEDARFANTFGSGSAVLVEARLACGLLVRTTARALPQGLVRRRASERTAA